MANLGTEYVADCELKLCKGEAYDVIQRVKFVVRQCMTYQTLLKKSMVSQNDKTQWTSPLHIANEFKKYCVDEYRFI